MYDILKSSIRKGRGKIITDSKGDGLGHGLAICGICGLIVAELYFKAPGWVFGWSLFALIISL